MKMAAFEYHRPTELGEALVLLAAHGSDAKVLAGGQSLVPMMAMRLSTPAHVVDITHVADVAEIRAAGDTVEIGAMVRHATAEASPIVHERLPLLAKALPWIGHRAIRNRGTVCGSLAHADPAAELPAVALALDAVMILQSDRGTREVAASDYFTGYLATAAAEDELLSTVRFPISAPGVGTAVVELSRRHGDFALAGVTCTLGFAEGSIAEAVISLFGVAGTPVRVAEAEAMLAGSRPSADAFSSAAAAVTRALDPPGDGHASGAYRRHVAGVLVRRALVAATADARMAMEAAA